MLTRFDFQSSIVFSSCLSEFYMYFSKTSTFESLSSTFLWGHEDYRRVKMLLTFAGNHTFTFTSGPGLHLKYLKVCFTGKSERRPTKRHCWRGVFGSGAPTVSLSVHLTQLPTVLFCIQLQWTRFALYPVASSLPLPLSFSLPALPQVKSARQHSVGGFLTR